MCLLLGSGMYIRVPCGAEQYLGADVEREEGVPTYKVCVSVRGILVNAVQTGSPALTDT